MDLNWRSVASVVQRSHDPTRVANVVFGMSSPAARLEVVWAKHDDDIVSAQRLRHQVFAGEMGAVLRPPPGTPDGLDVDQYDQHCEHLMVRTVGHAGLPPLVVGTYRVLLPEAAKRAGGFYTEQEFDLSPLRALRGAMAELGRSCIHPDWRQGAVILLLWSSLARFLAANGVRHVVGCASMPMHDGGHDAASLWSQLKHSHLAPTEHRVLPRLPLPVSELQQDLPVEAPALIKGYLRCGAQVLGPPAWDPDFGVADLPMHLDLTLMPASYQRRFMGHNVHGASW